MAAFISDDAKALSGSIALIFQIIVEKGGMAGMNRYSGDLVIRSFVDGINEIDILIRRPSVRVHLDPSIIKPMVDNDSSLNGVRRRLRRQVRAACKLADKAHLGPAANPDEQETIQGVKRVLERVYQEILPACRIDTE